MNWSIILLVVCILISVFFIFAHAQHFKKFRNGIPPPGTPKAKARAPIFEWITQRVDHFNPSDARTWEMRYLSNSQFFQEGGPIFIYLGGEWEIDPGWLMSGLMFDMADDHNGYMFYTEHRYYGTSFPTEDLSTENLQYLNIDQALADLAYFIEYKKSTTPSLENSKVVIVGGSYSATMATWMRIKYPHLIDASWASSAPLRAVADFYEYFEVVGHNLELASKECVNILREAVTEIEEHLENQEGITFVSNIFNTCERIDVTEPERGYFFSSLGNPFAGYVQYAQPGDLEQVCRQLESYPGRSIDKLAGFMAFYYGGWCISDMAYFVEWYQYTGLTDDIYRQWFYQTCTEYGFYQTSTSPKQPFGNGTWGVPMFVQMCEELYGYGADIMDTGIERTNLFYGSIEPQVTKLVSVHGTVDPWHAIGVLEDINPMAPVIVVNGTSHCADLYSISAYDIPELVAAKLRIKDLIAQWLAL